MGNALSGSYGRIQNYHQLVVDSNGETSVLEREFFDVEAIGYSNVPQLCRALDPRFARPTGVVFTRMSGENPWHHPPSPQLVVCLAGGWYVKTTDGATQELLPGSILFQDNVLHHPSALQGTMRCMHYSGSLTDYCDQMIVQLDMPDGPIYNSRNAPPPM